ncbi:MAG: LytTR family transcriptional regulator DNA-binding domain-containing protein [Caulobacterales bacterium]|nr:LytTR family transcriptional regulator DNA-binding domain-containing protein [Caulobacterales bacterium]
MAQSDIRGQGAAVRQRTGAAVGASWIAAFLDTRHLRGLGIAALAGVFLAAAGAFQTGEAPLVTRFAYWIPVMLVGAMAGIVVSVLVDRGGWFDDRPALQGMLIAVTLTAPLTVFIWAISSCAFHRFDFDLADLRFFVGPVFIVNCAMTALNYFTQKAPTETHAAPAGGAPPRFLERLPVKLRGSEIFAVEAEDHYLRLHTSKGQDLILMRLGDAVAELEGLEGAQVHRSWWVAKAAVEHARRGDGRATLTLKDGAKVPVSRAYAKALRASGWI